ncbi:hypothetical protein [Clostridium akagii]|nr:hypothetical protein [Clostridium akagii]
MDNLGHCNFSNLNIYVQPKPVQKTGLIHILANDEKRDVFWGDVDTND